MNNRTNEVNEIFQQAEEAASQGYTLADYDGDVEAYVKDAEAFVSEMNLDEHDMELFRDKVRELITE